MDIDARIEGLCARLHVNDIMRLAQNDFPWWVSEIESVHKEGKRACKDSARGPWYRHSLRSNAPYCKALSALLGGGFKVELGTGDGADPSMMGDDHSYYCVHVSW
jgi:hypothetical protein